VRRWAAPALCVLAAGGYLAVFLSTGQVATAIWTAAIMLAYGTVLVIFSRRVSGMAGACYGPVMVCLGLTV
jgi:hypothetical protein